MKYCYRKRVQDRVLCWEVVPFSEGPLEGSTVVEVLKWWIRTPFGVRTPFGFRTPFGVRTPFGFRTPLGVRTLHYVQMLYKCVLFQGNLYNWAPLDLVFSLL